MSSRRFDVTTAIPYVNGDPHLGHALELVQADVLARLPAAGSLPAAVDGALARFDLRAASGALWELAAQANRVVAAARPWERAGDRAELLGTLLATSRLLARELAPFLPAASERIGSALDTLDVGRGRALFAKAQVP